MPTLYAIATQEMRRLIAVYLQLAETSVGFTNVTPEMVSTLEERTITLAGIGSDLDPAVALPAEVTEEWRRRLAIPFDVERSITLGVYRLLREEARRLFREMEILSRGFTQFDSALLRQRPEMLPLLQHIGGVFSKAALKRTIGSVSDSAISQPAADRFSEYLQQHVQPAEVRETAIIDRMGSTLEGIVRDLVGRVLLERIVAAALQKEDIPFLPESAYASLKGVVYDFRADFVIPDDKQPLVFIEVRKSSTRHASLYAKDKMFSAINWKGHHTNLMGVLVVEGPWTTATLQVMAQVFDYVVPLSRVAELARTVRAYIDGDRSKLKWLIDFRIDPA